MQIKKRKVPNGLTATTGENGMGEVAKESKGIPVSVSASLGALKKKDVSASTGGIGPSIPSAKTEAMDSGHSEAYKEKIKKRVK